MLQINNFLKDFLTKQVLLLRKEQKGLPYNNTADYCLDHKNTSILHCTMQQSTYYSIKMS